MTQVAQSCDGRIAVACRCRVRHLPADRGMQAGQSVRHDRRRTRWWRWSARSSSGWSIGAMAQKNAGRELDRRAIVERCVDRIREDPIGESRAECARPITVLDRRCGPSAPIGSASCRVTCVATSQRDTDGPGGALIGQGSGARHDRKRPNSATSRKSGSTTRRTRPSALRNILMENYLHLVRYNAERIHVKLPDEVELDDLMSAGIFGLMDAIDAFDLERGVKFETYCAPRIRGAILDELRSMDWVPRLVRSPRPQARRRQQAARSRARPRADQRRARQAAQGPDGRVREDGQGRQRPSALVSLSPQVVRDRQQQGRPRDRRAGRQAAAPTRSARSSART